MTCNECKKYIKDFLDDSLNYRHTVDFIEHVRSCEDCMEELSIEYLVSEGLKRLDTATSFDLDTELHDKIDKSYNKAKFYKNFLFIIGSLIVIFAFLFGFFLSTLFAY
jgi:hypothetical protein